MSNNLRAFSIRSGMGFISSKFRNYIMPCYKYAKFVIVAVSKRIKKLIYAYKFEKNFYLNLMRN